MRSYAERERARVGSRRRKFLRFAGHRGTLHFGDKTLTGSDGIPRYIRCYDNGGTAVEGGTCDRYTVCFTGRAATEVAPNRSRWYPYVGMSAEPFHPQGFGQHGSVEGRPCDTTVKSAWPVAIGRKCHLGTRINFWDLPADCRKLVLRDYKEIWDLNYRKKGEPK